MSFILDALKKSEADRQRQSTPGIADVAEARDRNSSPRWLWIVMGLLAVNLVVLAVLLMRPAREPVSPEISVPPPATSRPAQTAGPMAATEPATREAPSSFSELVSEAKQRSPAAASEEPDPVPEAPPVAEPAARQPAAQSSAPSTLTQAYPTLNELRASGSVQLPDLHLDIHVYAERASERFVFINMNKYSEYATLTEGPTVSEIVPEGVILDYRGTEFLLPRQ
ncbi:MAG: general secretion pathway protein GspB [Gammaproteobacteria bacterium]|nr:general secretion pathway protein GspB [Gammaproteobacteria bacterium]